MWQQILTQLAEMALGNEQWGDVARFVTEVQRLALRKEDEHKTARLQSAIVRLQRHKEVLEASFGLSVAAWGASDFPKLDADRIRGQIIELSRAVSELEELLNDRAPLRWQDRIEQFETEKSLGQTIIQKYNELAAQRRTSERGELPAVTITRCPPGMAAGAQLESSQFERWGGSLPDDIDPPEPDPIQPLATKTRFGCL